MRAHPVALRSVVLSLGAAAALSAAACTATVTPTAPAAPAAPTAAPTASSSAQGGSGGSARNAVATRKPGKSAKPVACTTSDLKVTITAQPARGDTYQRAMLTMTNASSRTC